MITYFVFHRHCRHSPSHVTSPIRLRIPASQALLQGVLFRRRRRSGQGEDSVNLLQMPRPLLMAFHIPYYQLTKNNFHLFKFKPSEGILPLTILQIFVQNYFPLFLTNFRN